MKRGFLRNLINKFFGKEVSVSEEQVPSASVNVNTRELLIETLKTMNCLPTTPDEDRICFSWQGGYFIARARNDSSFIQIWYPQWAECELYDIDQMARMQRVINNCNYSNCVNVCYTIDSENDKFSVHSQNCFIFCRQIPHLKEYLEFMLSDFFEIRRFFERELDKETNEEERLEH